MNRRSIRILADLRPDLVLFSHGPPLRDMDALQDLLHAIFMLNGRSRRRMQ